MYDAYQKAPFSFKVDILTYVLDYPGIAKTFNLTGSGSYRACVWCDIKGKFARIKFCYMDVCACVYTKPVPALSI